MNNNLWPEDVQEAASKMGGAWLKAAEFDGEGLVLTIKSVETIKSSNPKYGALPTDYLVKKEVLEEGESFHYLFENAAGEEKMFDSKSAPLFIAMQQAQIEAGDTIHIKREGSGEKTRYDVSKVENGAAKQKSNEEKADKGSDSSPF